MKKVILILALGLFTALSYPTFASNPVSTFDNEFSEVLIFPKHLDLDRGFARFSFNVDAEGKLEVVEMNASDKQLTKYVKQQLKKIQLDTNDLRIGATYYYQVEFDKR